jgi:tetrapyrrole methylase family protein/MazG family protein
MSWFSLVETTLDALDLSVQNVQLADADELAARHYPNLSTDRPALVGLLSNAAQCQRLRRLLTRAYPKAHEVALVSGVDVDRPIVNRMALGELGHCPPEGGALLYVPPLPCPSAVETFQATVARLRAPGGCPWDQKQTHQSLRQGFLEESYEVLEALDRCDLELLKEELGDVLLHILLQVQIASERGEFCMSDVVCQVNHKIVYRHPHVFDGLAVDGVEQVLSNWEDLKRREKGDRTSASLPFEGIPALMPALARTQALLRRAARLGSLPETEIGIEGICNQVGSRLAEQSPLDGARFLGDLLFSLAALGSERGVDMESALREANERFEQRFVDQS